MPEPAAPAPPVAPAPPATPPPEPAAPAPPVRRGWRGVLESIPDLPRVTVSDLAAYLGYEEGTLHLAVRSDFNRARVYDALKAVDFADHFDGFRGLDLKVDDSSGRTGRETRVAADTDRRDAARRAAEASPVLRRLVEAFAGRIERVEPSGAAARDTSDPVEDERDE